MQPRTAGVAPASPANLTYFEFLELREKLSIDLKDLEKRFYALSRKWHPDRFARAGVEEQQRALDASAYLNDAYRALRDPVARTEYLLSLKGIEPGDSKKVPPALLEEVFELNMALEEVRMGDTDALPQLREAQTRFRAMLEESDSALEQDFLEWDATPDPAILERLRARLNHRKYISNLVRETEKALEHHVSD
jgi:molecular chaperone HscB